MSGPDNDDEYKVGWKRPPRQSQYKKGTSGNPGGRKPKPRKPPPIGAASPITQMLRAEAERPILIKEGDRRTSVSTSEAVFRAMVKTALQGGVLAQRNVMELLMADDEQQFRARREVFEHWREYVRGAEQSLKRAALRGEHLEPVPHPQDIVFDYTTLEVRFTGPLSCEDAASIKDLKQLGDLFYEMSLYFEETISYHRDDLLESEVGPWMFVWIHIQRVLPPRLRGVSGQLQTHVERGICLPRRAWRRRLEEECRRRGFLLPRAANRSQTISLREIGWAFR